MKIKNPWPLCGSLLILACASRPSPLTASAQKPTAIRPAATKPSPIRPGPRDLKQLVFGHYHGCALYYDGTVSCWHAHQWDPLEGQPSDPLPVAGLPPIRSLDLGVYAACGLTLDGEVYCWSAPRTVKPEMPVPDGAVNMDLSGAVQLEVANYYACALLLTGELACWNNSFGGMSGTFGTPSRRSKPEVRRFVINGETNLMCLLGDTRARCGNGGEPLELPAGDALQIGLGDGFGCIRSPRGVRCFDARNPNGHVPSLIPGTEDAVFLSVGDEHNCIQARDGKILCWGNNANGEVDPTSLAPTVPNPVVVGQFPTDFRLTAHNSVTCVNSPNAEYHCWGRCGQLPPLPKLECRGTSPGFLPRDELVQ